MGPKKVSVILDYMSCLIPMSFQIELAFKALFTLGIILTDVFSS